MIGSEFFAEPFGVAGAGAMFAVVLRWLLGLHIEGLRAAAIGAVSCVLIPLIRLGLVPPMSAGPSADFVVGAAVASWLLVIAHALHAQ